MKTQKKIEMLTNNEDFKTAVTYASGIYLLQSIITTWWLMMEEHLRKAGCLSFDFKYEFMAAKNALEKFERTLAKNVSPDEKLPFVKDYDSVEPVLRNFIFGNEKKESND